MFLFIIFLDVICVNVASTAILRISCTNSLFPVLMNWVPYIFPHQTLSQVPQQLSINFPFWVLPLCSRATWFIHILLLMCNNLCLLVHIGHSCQFGIIFPYLVVPCMHCCHLWLHPWQWRLPVNLFVIFLWSHFLAHYAYLMSSHILPLQWNILLWFVLLLPHIL